MNRLKHILRNLVVILNVVIILGMVVTGFSGCVSPSRMTYISVISLVFPFFVLADFAFIALWFFINKIYMLIPIVGLLICASPIRNYCPFNFSNSIPDDAIKILTYNTLSFGGKTEADLPNVPIIQYVKDCDADIVCLQESFKTSISQASIRDALSQYQYMDTISTTDSQHGDLLILSKFPIIKQLLIPMEDGYKGACAFWIKIEGEEVIVIDAHLESNQINSNEKEKYLDVLRGIRDNDISKDSVKAESITMARKLYDASVRRAKQADAVAKFLEAHQDESIIMCGDFNDNPLSYVNHQIGRHLTNCYVGSGNGPGLSYNQKGFNVRIDNIYATKDWTSYGAKVDNNITDSDHYPVFCWLKKK